MTFRQVSFAWDWLNKCQHVAGAHLISIRSADDNQVQQVILAEETCWFQLFRKFVKLDVPTEMVVHETVWQQMHEVELPR